MCQKGNCPWHLITLNFGNIFKETAEIEPGMAGNSSWDQAKRRQKLGLVWRIRKKISKIIKEYFCLPFFLLIILWLEPTPGYGYVAQGGGFHGGAHRAEHGTISG
jgi:hypothetical protein